MFPKHRGKIIIKLKLFKVQKCGTDALDLFMEYHPELALRHFFAGEGHYFDIERVRTAVTTNLYV